MRFVDTHLHLTSYDNIDEVVRTAHKEGVEELISISTNISDSRQNVEIANKYPNVYCCVGIYPHDTDPTSKISLKEQFKILETLAQDKKVVGIGECGFDFSNGSPNEKVRSKKEREDVFAFQINLSKKLKKPLMIHSRLATPETLSFLNLYYSVIKNLQSDITNGVWHCFVEDLKTAKKIINLGFSTSVNGIITYNSGQELANVVKKIPLKKIVLETDAPLLTPAPLRSKTKTNRPEYVKITAQKLALIKSLSLEEVSLVTSQNARLLFNIQ